MSVRVHLDNPYSHYTNLDLVTGKVVLNLQSEESIQEIVVKLEGESKSRLEPNLEQDHLGGRVGQRRQQRRAQPMTEVHKILYKLSTVFPSEDIKKHTTTKSGYTLRSGQYEYPFSFKIPINNKCNPQNSLYNNISFGGRGVEVARDPDRHITKTLPPSLRGFPGEAEIKYYVKVTVVRPKFFQENHRSVSEVVMRLSWELADRCTVAHRLPLPTNRATSPS
jgi:Arrestin (or S-antigen), N-terminal domain